MELLKKIHESLKPTIYFATLITLIIFATHLFGEISKLLGTKSWTDQVALTIMAIIIIYWAIAGAYYLFLPILKKANK